jgi:hypothetical protein
MVKLSRSMGYSGLVTKIGTKKPKKLFARWFAMAFSPYSKTNAPTKMRVGPGLGVIYLAAQIFGPVVRFHAV